jgi:hypothetical protein
MAAAPATGGYTANPDYGLERCCGSGERSALFIYFFDIRYFGSWIGEVGSLTSSLTVMGCYVKSLEQSSHSFDTGTLKRDENNPSTATHDSAHQALIPGNFPLPTLTPNTPPFALGRQNRRSQGCLDQVMAA